MQLSGHTTVQTGKLEATRELSKAEIGNTEKFKDHEREGKREKEQGEEKRETQAHGRSGRQRHTVVQRLKKERHTAAKETERTYTNTQCNRQQLVRPWVQDLQDASS